MSRLGKMPIPVPSNVKVTVSGSKVAVEGPLGKLEKVLPAGLQARLESGQILVSRANDSTVQKSLHGTYRKLVLNMVEGVSKGFTKLLQIEGVGFRAQVAGNKLSMTLGLSHPVDFDVPAGLKVVVDQKQTGLTLTGADRELLGRVAATIRSLRLPEPYKGTGIRYADEHIRRKAGKSAVGAGAPGAGGGGGAKK
ncbi:MAG TPA: 50S ribosomal protein L6 [Elusimicrobiota bacterium]|nr:50S ribosomal protein L6 [Elusimicrobiota bacterium]